LSNLAELKMLIRDEHIRSGESQKRLKWKFGQDVPEPLASPDPPAPPAPLAQGSSTSSDQHTDDSNPEDEGDETSDPATVDSDGEFASMIAEMERMVQQDEDPEADAERSDHEISISVTISGLFDFSKSWGVSELEVGRQNLNTETELAELIDKAGITDDGGLDSVTEAVLNGL
jgi:hypothetical protein